MESMVWSPLDWGRLTGKRNRPLPKGRAKSGGLVGAPPVSDEYLYNVVDVLEEIALETERTIPQVAINWLVQNPTVSNVVIGARNEKQLLANLDAVGWSLNGKQMELNEVSFREPIYPHWVRER